ncbi:hypothetical protein [Nostoc commune]|uniref:hypothetical protein n=1 Tax=Nostoc commune TaxID=1178 RepID=UPI0018C80737|nr:hypothetical protein [Nostoc commune]MBG1261672.1 hypothetical protein [Nostoc commune BAE]
MITQLPLTSFQSMPISDRFLDILYVRPAIATVGRIMEKAIEDIWRLGWQSTHPAGSMDLSEAFTLFPTLTEY